MVTEQEIKKVLPDLFKKNGIQEINQLEECFYCGCKSKFKTKPIQTMMGPKSELICIAEVRFPKLHDELVGKMENLFEERGHPKSYVAELKKEINEIKAKFKDIPNLEIIKV